jgi:hypothetical protein
LAASPVTCFLSNSVELKKAAFLLRLSSPSSTSSSSSRLFGINEWRDLDFKLPGRSRETLGNDEAPPRSICILPFPYQEVLLQGETKQLRLYEDRFIKLFQNVVENHASVVGMGLMANSGIIQTMPLCEVEASINTLEGTFGIFVTIRVVGRASLLEITQQEPYLRGACIEVADVLPPNLELPNLLANNIENHMLLLSSMEQRFKEAKLRNNSSSSGNNNTATSTSNVVQDEEMATRIALAKLVSVLYIVLISREECSGLMLLESGIFFASDLRYSDLSLSSHAHVVYYACRRIAFMLRMMTIQMMMMTTTRTSLVWIAAVVIDKPIKLLCPPIHRAIVSVAARVVIAANCRRKNSPPRVGPRFVPKLSPKKMPRIGFKPWIRTSSLNDSSLPLSCCVRKRRNWKSS